ncbi:S1C family serine protease [Subtercola endophyticus]|uniref:S1C family serine protease n=1 Tax=Subtercola endophyticus TaxID=2895559 RepID=UPI001E35210A|nr:trypsin-like peptidase domain-containing protein [Subtercola endophyticus]UFS60498.1 trypsin-like peptidase domain-containing protein [Subtercola endophyticus]
METPQPAADQPSPVEPVADIAQTPVASVAPVAPVAPTAIPAQPVNAQTAAYPQTPNLDQQYAQQQYAGQPNPQQQYAQQTPGQQYPGQPYAQQPAPTQPQQAHHTHSDRIWRPRTFLILGAAAAALLVGGASVGATLAAGVPLALSAFSSHTSVIDNGTTGTTNGGSGSSGSTGSGSTGSGNGFVPGSGSNGYGYGYGSGSGSSGSTGDGSGSTGSGAGTSTSAATDATDAESVGVVLINTELKYESAAAAGTGIVLTSDGEILTNNHVVEGSTSITVTVPQTGKTYTATVVGTDATHDVAVLKLADASGLTTAKVDTSNSVAAGDDVTGVGNAGGTGTLSAAAGTVDALNQSVTTEAEGSAASETLSGMIQISADIQAGDSGGPLLDSDGEVIGIDTAASSGSSDVTGFAIPINSALSIAKQILSGTATDSIVIGYPAFLGIEVGSATSGLGVGGQGTGSSTTAGASVAGVIDGTPAATAGLAAGDTITAVNGTAVASGSDLTSTLKSFKPGDSITVSWTDSTGAAQSAKVTLIQGPAA